MFGNHLPARHVAIILALSGICLLPGLGQSSRLSYHEAIWAQSAREMLASGVLQVPTLDGRPWLEKPPLGVWPIAFTGWLFGHVDETVARLPSALAALTLVLGVAVLAARRFGATIGLLTGCVQSTSLWLILRGRLAEVDILLACLVTWAIVAFDMIRSSRSVDINFDLYTCSTYRNTNPRSERVRWLFFILLGSTALAKGVGFGAALLVATVATTVLWDRDRASGRALLFLPGVALAGLVALAWPLTIIARYPAALQLWTTHITDRLSVRSGQFAGELWWDYGLSYFWQTLPWTPLALIGLRQSWSCAVRQRLSLDRLLWAWATVPAILVSLASVRNAHYLIYALPPWSIWSALGVMQLGARLRGYGYSAVGLRTVAIAAFGSLSLLWALSFLFLVARFDRRSPEWAFYQRASRQLVPNEPLTLIYDWPDWDRFPYATPFGPMPHDLAVRLFYLDRRATWCVGVGPLVSKPSAVPFAVIARVPDAVALRALGCVETIACGPTTRRDRTYVLYRVVPERKLSARPSRPLTR